MARLGKRVLQTFFVFGQAWLQQSPDRQSCSRHRDDGPCRSFGSIEFRQQFDPMKLPGVLPILLRFQLEPSGGSSQQDPGQQAPQRHHPQPQEKRAPAAAKQQIACTDWKRGCQPPPSPVVDRLVRFRPRLVHRHGSSLMVSAESNAAMARPGV